MGRRVRAAFPEYKMCAPNMMFGDIVVEVNTGIILSIDKVIGDYVISRLYYDKENSLSSHGKYLILSRAASRFRQAITHEVSLLSKNLPTVEGSTEEDCMYLDYLRTVLDNKLNNRVMQRLEAGCTFKIGYDTFIGPGDLEIVSNSCYQELICNGPWRLVRDYDVPMLDEIFERLEKKSGRKKKVVERPITVMVNGKEVKVSDKLMKELKKLVE